MSKTISTSVPGPVVLNPATDNPLTITSAGTVTSTGAGNDGIDGSGANWIVGNSGTVSSGSADGIKLSGGTLSSVTNNAGGEITSTGTVGGGPNVGAALYIKTGSGNVTNNGSISGGAYGVELGGGGTVTNTSSITGGEDAIKISGGTSTISNTGTVTGTVDDAIGLFGGGSITNASGATISSAGTAGAAVYATGGAVNVTNSGNVSSAFHGFVIDDGGTVTNNAGATITAVNTGVFFKVQPGTVSNSGNISGTGTASGTGVYLENNGNITNTSTGTISGAIFGAFIEGGGGTISNSGSIAGVSNDGVVLGMGGMVTNNAGGNITGGTTGVYVKYRAAGTVTNSGRIAGTAASSTGVDLAAGGSVTNNAGGNITGSAVGVFMSGSANTVTNAGTISGATDAINFTGSGTNRLIVDPGAMFIGNVTANGTAANTLELASGTGTISGIGTGSFSNFQTLEADTGGVWTLTGANTAPTVLDNGTLSIAGSLDATTALEPTSTGLFQLQTGGTLEVAAATGAGTQVEFLGSSELIVDSVSSFGSNVGTPSYAGTQLQDFVNGDTIDLKNFSSTGVNFSYNSSTGVLQLSNGATQVASLEFQTSSLGSTDFQATSDGASGTLITTAVSPPPPVDNDGLPEPPVLMIANSSLPVTAGGSVALGIAVTPVDSDDTTLVTISGVPQGFENIVANNGGQPVSHHGANYTFTEAEVNSGLTLVSSYKGHGHPVNTLTVTASNTTVGEAAASAAQTITVTDPPANLASHVPTLIPFTPSAPVGHLEALFDLFASPGLHDSGTGGQIASLLDPHSGPQDLAFFTGGGHHG